MTGTLPQTSELRYPIMYVFFFFSFMSSLCYPKDSNLLLTCHIILMYIRSNSLRCNPSFFLLLVKFVTLPFKKSHSYHYLLNILPFHITFQVYDIGCVTGHWVSQVDTSNKLVKVCYVLVVYKKHSECRSFQK